MEIKELQLREGRNFVRVIRHRNGNDWEVQIYPPAGEPIFRFFSVHHNVPDLGLLNVSRRIRQEFGITGTYSPVYSD